MIFAFRFEECLLSVVEASIKSFAAQEVLSLYSKFISNSLQSKLLRKPGFSISYLNNVLTPGITSDSFFK